ncbi:MAG: hypothetical protein U1E17_01140 [Geminicoccaceae bacterium]
MTGARRVEAGHGRGEGTSTGRARAGRLGAALGHARIRTLGRDQDAPLGEGGGTRRHLRPRRVLDPLLLEIAPAGVAAAWSIRNARRWAARPPGALPPRARAAPSRPRLRQLCAQPLAQLGLGDDHGLGLLLRAGRPLDLGGIRLAQLGKDLCTRRSMRALPWPGAQPVARTSAGRQQGRQGDAQEDAPEGPAAPALRRVPSKVARAAWAVAGPPRAWSVEKLGCGSWSASALRTGLLPHLEPADRCWLQFLQPIVW